MRRRGWWRDWRRLRRQKARKQARTQTQAKAWRRRRRWRAWKTPLWLLEGREAVPCDRQAWIEWFMRDGLGEARRVGLHRELGVSTAFVGTNQPFETAIVREPGGRLEVVERYWTWAEAEAGHARWVAQLDRARVSAGDA